jgi:hypothetical protein
MVSARTNTGTEAWYMDSDMAYSFRVVVIGA